MGSTVYIGKTIGKDVVIYNGVNVLTNLEDGIIPRKIIFIIKNILN